MCEAKACELPRGGNAFGPATNASPLYSESSKLPAPGGGFVGYDAHALPGRCLPVMFLLSTNERNVRTACEVSHLSHIMLARRVWSAVVPDTYNNTVNRLVHRRHS